MHWRFRLRNTRRAVTGWMMNWSSLMAHDAISYVASVSVTWITRQTGRKWRFTRASLQIGAFFLERSNRSASHRKRHNEIASVVQSVLHYYNITAGTWSVKREWTNSAISSFRCCFYYYFFFTSFSLRDDNQSSPGASSRRAFFIIIISFFFSSWRIFLLLLLSFLFLALGTCSWKRALCRRRRCDGHRFNAAARRSTTSMPFFGDASLFSRNYLFTSLVMRLFATRAPCTQKAREFYQ